MLKLGSWPLNRRRWIGSVASAWAGSYWGAAPQWASTAIPLRCLAYGQSRPAGETHVGPPKRYAERGAINVGSQRNLSQTSQ